MTFAYVYIAATKEYKIVRTGEVHKFSVDDYDSEEDESKKKVYKLLLPNSKKTNCQVLKTGDTMEYLKRFASAKRVKVPKLRTSQVYQDIESDEDTVALEVKKRKVDKAVHTNAMTARNSSIIAAHLRAQKVSLQVLGNKNNVQSTDSSDGEIDPEPSDAESVKKVSSVKLTQAKIQSEHQEESDDVESEVESSKEALFNKLQKERRISSEWRRKYLDLIASKAYGLTEKTGKDIVDILSRASNRILIEDDADDQDTSGQTRAPKEGTVKDDKIYIGENVWITKIAYDDIYRETEPSKFITNACYAVWGEPVLAARCVRAQSNVAESELSPSKKGAVLKMFTKWMTEKRMMPQHLIEEQLNRPKYNRYFNGAITAARKKIGYSITKNTSQSEKDPSANGDVIEKLISPEDDGPAKKASKRKSAKLGSLGAKRAKEVRNKPKQ